MFFISSLVDESMFKCSSIIYYIKEKLLPETHFYSCRQTEIIIFKDLKLFLEECHHFLLILLTTYTGIWGTFKSCAIENLAAALAGRHTCTNRAEETPAQHAAFILQTGQKNRFKGAAHTERLRCSLGASLSYASPWRLSGPVSPEKIFQEFGVKSLLCRGVALTCARQEGSWWEITIFCLFLWWCFFFFFNAQDLSE